MLGIKLGDGGVSPLELRTAAMALLRHGPRMPPQRREELKQVVMKYYGGRDISNEDLENALLTGMSPHEKRRMRKKRGLSLNPSSKNIVLNKKVETINKNEINESEDNITILDSDINSKLNGAGFATCSSKLSLLGHGPHGKQVVDYLLKEYGEDGIREFCQKWRQVFVEAINPRFLPAGWDATHSGRREFGDFSVYNPANKASAAAIKD